MLERDLNTPLEGTDEITATFLNVGLTSVFLFELLIAKSLCENFLATWFAAISDVRIWLNQSMLSEVKQNEGILDVITILGKK